MPTTTIGKNVSSTFANPEADIDVRVGWAPPYCEGRDVEIIVDSLRLMLNTSSP
jgi:hypothetical protein